MSAQEKYYSLTPAAKRAAEIVKNFPQLEHWKLAGLLWSSIATALIEAENFGREQAIQVEILEEQVRVLKEHLAAAKGAENHE